MSAPSKIIWRSVGAVAAGFVAVAIVSLGTDVVMHSTGVYPPWGQRMSDALFAFATLYRTIYGIGGSYITARLAPNKPMRHAIAGAVIGIILSTVATIATWNKGPEFGPHWYPMALIVLTLPTAWLGATIYLAKQPGAASSFAGKHADVEN